ncbi:MAG: hypothetical protein IJ020_03465 [Bacteroidaceae bacterium]|nr:hypothetical protein [Bacteroidaceae bacterium]
MRVNKLVRKLILVLVLFRMSTLLYAWEHLEVNITNLHFTLVEVNPELIHPRTPIEFPQVGQAGHMLYLFNEDVLSLNLYSLNDNTETLEFSTDVSASHSEVELPKNLSGTYILELNFDGMCFRAEIEL